MDDTVDALRPAYRADVPASQEKSARLPSRLAADVVDLFVYVVVLNLFIEYVPQVVSETFTLSLLTAVLLKAVLEVVLVGERRLKSRLKRAATRLGKVAVALLLWLLLVASKFVVLEAVNFVFGSRVSLGGFVAVTLLILTLLVSREAVHRLLRPETRTDLDPAA